MRLLTALSHLPADLRDAAIALYHNPNALLAETALLFVFVVFVYETTRYGNSREFHEDITNYLETCLALVMYFFVVTVLPLSSTYATGAWGWIVVPLLLLHVATCGIITARDLSAELKFRNGSQSAEHCIKQGYRLPSKSMFPGTSILYGLVSFTLLTYVLAGVPTLYIVQMMFVTINNWLLDVVPGASLVAAWLWACRAHYLKWEERGTTPPPIFRLRLRSMARCWMPRLRRAWRGGWRLLLPLRRARGTCFFVEVSLCCVCPRYTRTPASRLVFLMVRASPMARSLCLTFWYLCL